MNALTKTNEKRVATESNQGVQGQATRRYLSPRVNITETKDGYFLEAEMPGVSKEGLEVSLEGNELTLVGRRNVHVEGAEVLYRESVGRDFRRVFALDPTIDTSRIEARMENGVLKLHLPKTEKVKPRRISVSA